MFFEFRYRVKYSREQAVGAKKYRCVSDDVTPGRC